jgi:general secretion pathway protein C
MTERHQQWIVNAVMAALVIAFGLQLSWWAWHFLAPQAPVATASNSSTGEDFGDVALARTLFGEAEIKAADAPASDIRLKGVFAVDGITPSVAVVNIGAKDFPVRLGEAVMKDVNLQEVHADHIIISRGGTNERGTKERIELERFRGPVTATAATQTRAPASGSFRLNVASTGGGAYSLSRQELNSVLQDPRQMEFLGRIGVAPNGGVRIDDAGGNTLAGKLGLQAGDVISMINGQPVNSAGDLARLYGQFNTLSQVRVEVKRGGVPTMLNYAIQN